MGILIPRFCLITNSPQLEKLQITRRSLSRPSFQLIPHRFATDFQLTPAEASPRYLTHFMYWQHGQI